jgi:hypothetical protein
VSLYPLLVAAVNAGDPPATPPTYVELLPATASSKHSGIRWTPSADEFGPTAGTLVIDVDRSRSVYVLSEFPTGWDGRGFHFEKVTAGTDKDEDSYDVFVSRNGQDHLCGCRGFCRHGHCKHVSSVLALLENDWL